MMNATIRKLIALMDEETACYRDMQILLTDEEASLSLIGRDRFEQVQQAKEASVVKIRRYEKMRIDLVNQVATACQVKEPVVRASQLVKHLRAPDGEKLQTRVNRLRSVIEGVQLKNQTNQRLIHHYLELSKNALTLLTRLIYDDSIYQKPGISSAAGAYRSRGGHCFYGSA
jgi:flagellar biosynthesis/type III secretory pathway chaperone